MEFHSAILKAVMKARSSVGLLVNSLVVWTVETKAEPKEKLTDEMLVNKWVEWMAQSSAEP